jgi:hypothetical protein
VGFGPQWWTPPPPVVTDIWGGAGGTRRCLGMDGAEPGTGVASSPCGYNTTPFHFKSHLTFLNKINYYILYKLVISRIKLDDQEKINKNQLDTRASTGDRHYLHVIVIQTCLEYLQ